MNMNKILAAGLIAAVASTASFAQCGNGGFYVGANAGVAFTKMKINSATAYTGTGLAGDTHKAGESCSVSKKKTKFLADLVFGYDHRINDVMLGVDLTFGMMFGKTKVGYDGWGRDDAGDGKDFVTAKNTWNIALMPRVGYLVMPQLELYATAGVKMAHFKVSYTDEKENTNFAYNNPTSAKKMKFIPVVGGGLRYEITPDIYAKLEYNYDFRKGLKMPTDLSRKSEQDAANGGGNANSVKIPAHIIKLGVGFRF